MQGFRINSEWLTVDGATCYIASDSSITTFFLSVVITLLFFMRYFFDNISFSTSKIHQNEFLLFIDNFKTRKQTFSDMEFKKIMAIDVSIVHRKIRLYKMFHIKPWSTKTKESHIN